MSYQVLYRKWRPQTFSDVYGQELIVDALRGEMRTGRLAHAYLFTGSRGTGKTSCAKILAKAVNCLDLRDGDPCNECDSCRGIDAGTILDVVEIDAASNNGVDNIRDLREEVGFTPAVAKYRVYIIDEVHMLSAGAFNALLKTLEEPPVHAIFILATTEVHKLPATILSRCQRFDFSRISPEAIAARISFISANESFSVSDDAALLIARIADGGMRDALSLLDQCVSRSDNITADTVIDAAGMAGHEHVFELSAAVREGNSAAALSLIGSLHEGSKDMERLCVELIDFYRSLMIIKSVPEPGALIIASPAETEQLREEAALYELDKILHTIDALQRTLDRLRRGVSRRTEMEMAILRLCSPELDIDITALSSRITALERAVKAGRIAAPAPVQEPAQASAVNAFTPASAPPTYASEPPSSTSAFSGESPAFPVSPPVSAPAVMEAPLPEIPFEEWEDVLDELSSSCAPLFGVLRDSTAVLRGDHVLIQTGNPLFRSLVGQDNNKAALSAAIQNATGRTYRVGMKKSAPAPADISAPVDPLSNLLEAGRKMGVEIETK